LFSVHKHSRLSSTKQISSVIYNGQNMTESFRYSFSEGRKGMEGYRKEKKMKRQAEGYK
jgi:hypothetical protein